MPMNSSELRRKHWNIIELDCLWLMDVERRKWEEREFRLVDQSDKVNKSAD